MNAWDFANKHPIVTLLLADAIFANACKLVNNIVVCRESSKHGGLEYEETVTTTTEEVSEEEPDTVKSES